MNLNVLLFAFLLLMTGLTPVIRAADFEYRPYILWENKTPYPERQNLTFPKDVQDVMVHRAGADDYNFLHDAAIVSHKNTLYAAWYNCPDGEMQDSSLIRGRRSKDGGKTWSDVEVIASDKSNKGIMYVPVAFLSYQGTLYAFVSNMIGADEVTHCEMFVLDEKEDQWITSGFIAGPFLPNCAPKPMQDGSFIMAGRMADKPGQKPIIPAVAIGDGSNLTKTWKVIPLLPDGELDDGTKLKYPESTVFVEKNEITALVRRHGNNFLLFKSSDYGRSWSKPFQHNFMMGGTKLYAGRLSTGQRYLLFNFQTEEYRDVLALAVSKPGEKTFCKMWKIRDGYSDALKAGPEWSYPCAIEKDGTLYVVYTSEKHHCVLTVIPTVSLAME